MAKLLLGLVMVSLTTSAGAADLEALDELLGVVVVRSEDGRVESVSVPCVETRGLAVRELGATRGDPEPEDRVRVVLDALVRLDPQRADDLRARLERLLGGRRFSAEQTLQDLMLESGAWGSRDALTAELHAAEPMAELAEGETLEPLSGRVRESGSDEGVVVIDEALWVELDHGEQAAVLLMQLTAAERNANHGFGPHPCAQLGALALGDLANLTIADYFQAIGEWQPPVPAIDEPVTTARGKAVRADLLFRPMDRPLQETHEQLIRGYPIRKLGVIDWSAWTELRVRQEETTRRTSGDADREVSQLYSSALVGADFDGYIFHPELFRFGITGAVLTRTDSLESDLENRTTHTLSPQFGFSGYLLGAKKVSYLFSANKYRSEAERASESYSVTDADEWRVGVRIKYPVLPVAVDFRQRRTDAREATAARRRQRDETRVDLLASNTVGPSHTKLEYKYLDVSERRIHVNGEVRMFDQAWTNHLAVLTNRWLLKSLDTELQTWLKYRGESGDRRLETWSARQSMRLHHGPDLWSRHEWSWSSRRASRKGDLLDDEIQTSSWRARGFLHWDATADLDVFGSASYQEDDLDAATRSSAALDAGSRWFHRWKGVNMTVWGNLSASRSDESGETGLSLVTDEFVTLVGQSPVVLESPDIVETSVLVRSEDGGIMYEAEADYRLMTQDDLLEIVRVETGTIPDGATVRLEYTTLVEVRAPIEIQNTALRAGFRFGLLDERAYVEGRWESYRFDVNSVDEEAVDRARFDPLDVFNLKGGWDLGPFELRAEHDERRRPGASATTNQLGATFARALTPIQALWLGVTWSATEFEAADDVEEWIVDLRYSWSPLRRWPGLSLEATYRSFERGDYSGTPWEVTLELERDYRWLDFFLRASWSVRDERKVQEEAATYEVILSHVW